MFMSSEWRPKEWDRRCKWPKRVSSTGCRDEELRHQREAQGRTAAPSYFKEPALGDAWTPPWGDPIWPGDVLVFPVRAERCGSVEGCLGYFAQRAASRTRQAVDSGWMDNIVRLYLWPFQMRKTKRTGCDYVSSQCSCLLFTKPPVHHGNCTL